MTTTEQQLTPDVVNGLDFKVADLSLADYGILITLVAALRPALRATSATVVVQDPCHLRHVQRAHAAVRTALAPAYTLVDTDDDGLCCGAGGAYAVLQPELAGSIRDRKADALRRAGAGAGAVVVSANPGCMLHLRQAGLDVRHPADLLAAALKEGTRG